MHKGDAKFVFSNSTYFLNLCCNSIPVDSNKRYLKVVAMRPNPTQYIKKCDTQTLKRLLELIQEEIKKRETNDLKGI